jgi:hypothetical protein
MILLPGQIESIASRKDKTVKLTIGTQELSPQQAAEIFSLNQSFCYFAVKPENFTKDESDAIENLKTELYTAKTPSQRLRSVLYLNYLQDPKGYQDFGNFYLAEIEKIIDHFKRKLES